MDHFIDITVLPDPEFKETVLMNALFAKLHRHIGLVAPGEIAVSFPKHHVTLGPVLRLHGGLEHLEQLHNLNWLKGLRDYTQHTEVRSAPENCQFRTVKRVQAKSVYNRRKRSVAKGWLSENEAIERIPDELHKELKLPFAQITSLSNGNQMRVYVQHGEIAESPTSGRYSSYGLSSTATIPWF